MLAPSLLRSGLPGPAASAGRWRTRGTRGRPVLSLGTLFGRLLLATLATWSGAWAAEGTAGPARFTEAGVKAAFLLNFANYAEWPAIRMGGTNTPLVIGVFGHDEVAAILQDLVQRKTGLKRPYVVVGLTSTNEARGCHLVFVGKTRDADEVIATVKGMGVLTVGESSDFLERGGMIQFSLVEEHVVFDIQQLTIEDSGLKISSKVLALARRVGRKSGPPLSR